MQKPIRQVRSGGQGLSAALVVMVTAVFLTGCDTLGYYSQAAHGQFSMLAARESVSKLIDDPSTEPQLKAQLIKSQEILDFAREYGLPVEKTYSQYVDLGRPYVVWNVFAAQPDSINLVTHCFPIAGCVGYKGYFKQEAAHSYAQALKDQGLDVFVGGVTAYSSLGWFNDPLLNTFLFRSDERLSATLFHELAHKVLYVEGDTVFNESYATAVEHYLLERWLKSQQRESLYKEYVSSGQRREAVIALILETRQKLAEVYASGVDEVSMQAQKAEVLSSLKQRYQELRQNWSGGNEFAAWMAQDLNNAHLGAIGAYQSQVPAFTAMLENQGLEAFFAQVKRIGELPKAERDRILAEHCHTHEGDHPCAN